MLRYMTAGESHGQCLLGIIEGLPSGLVLIEDFINMELHRRQSGYGRGTRQAIEQDRAALVSGIVRTKTTGAPLGIIVGNRDHSLHEKPELFCPRPGHADLVGSLKYDEGIREILERASARETAVRVAIGAVAKQLLAHCGIVIAAQVVQIGSVAIPEKVIGFREMAARARRSPVGCAVPSVERKMIAAIDAAKKRGDTLGGIVEVRAIGVPAGLGSCMHPDRKLDGRLAQELMSIQAIKAVAFGLGWGVAERYGSQVHDAIYYSKANGYYRRTDNAGGIEGGMSTGEEIVVRAAMKPIATLMRPLASVHMKTKRPANAAVERSDTCAVMACSVIAEAAVAWVLAAACSEKFAGDSLREMKRNMQGYVQQLRKR